LLQPVWNFRSKDSAVQAGKDTKPLKGSTWLKERQGAEKSGPFWTIMKQQTS
jgi:hypothetical protein